MKRPLTTAAMTAAVAAVVVLAALAYTGGALLVHAMASTSQAADRSAVAVTSGLGAGAQKAGARTHLAGLEPANGSAQLASLMTVRPAPGAVVQARGPFDDRFTMTGLSFSGDAVRGSLTVTSDVSDILELEVLAGFYDKHGRLLGTARFVHHLDEGAAAAHGHDAAPVELQVFSINVPQPLHGHAVSAAVGVPVLVNE